nr:unnamed protein product [Digitaria exilis]
MLPKLPDQRPVADSAAALVERLRLALLRGQLLRHAELFLPRTPMDVVEKIRAVWGWGVGFIAIGFMASGVLSFNVHDTRVLVGCTCAAAAFMVTLVALWVWLARTYGGSGSYDHESSNE